MPDNYHFSSAMTENRVLSSRNVEDEKPSMIAKTPRPPKVAAKPPSKLRTKTANGTTPKYRSKSPPPVLNPTPKVNSNLVLLRLWLSLCLKLYICMLFIYDIQILKFQSLKITYLKDCLI